MLVFNLVFGQTVADISLNAVANLGYARGVFGCPVYAGDTLCTRSEVIGLREVSSGDAGIVYVKTESFAQDKRLVCSFCRWVLVKKKGQGRADKEAVVPDFLPLDESLFSPLDLGAYKGLEAAGSSLATPDYRVGQKIDHVFGMTIEEAEHQQATRLYQNPARLHFEAPLQAATRFGRRLVYGGYLIALARALSFNGLPNAVRVLALHGGRHAAPFFAGDTLYAGSEVLAVTEDSLRIRLMGLKNRPFSEGFPAASDPSLVLELELTLQMPQKC